MLNAFYGSLFFKRRSLIKTLKIMNITAILLLACCLQVSARVNSQGVTLNVKNAPLQKVFQEIKKQTGYSFMYTETILKEAKKVSMEVKNSSLQDALAICFSSQPFTYKIINQTVVVQPKEKTYQNISNTTNEIPLPPPPVEIHGKVVNQQGEPLQNVSVLIAGTKIGTTTDNNGFFRLTAPDNKNIVLEVSSVGFQKKRVNVGRQTEINIVLEIEAAGLSDVVVVGYGTQQKKNLTGAVGTIKSDFIENRPITNVSQALQGGVSGVFVNQNSGQPGNDDAQILIRGIGTLNNSNPLILVDGVEAPINNVDPNDIASISVLKDAASASIYGSRAANGVVLITTKRGKMNQKSSIAYSGYFGSSEATHLPKMVNNSGQFMELYNEARVNSGYSTAFTDAEISDYKQNGPNTNWLNEVFRKGTIQEHHVSISGGGAKTTYLLSAGNLNQTGITPSTSFKRYNMRLNLDSRITDKLTIGTNISLSTGKTIAPREDLLNSGGDQGIIAQALKANPLFPAFDSQGRIAGQEQALGNSSGWKGFGNPFAQSAYNKFRNIRNQLLGSVFTEYEFIKGLKAKATFAVNYQTTDGSSFGSKGDTYDWKTGNPILSLRENTLRGRGLSNSRSVNLTTLFQATYERKFGSHHFNGLVGFNQESFSYGAFGAGRINFPSNTVQVLGAGDPTRATNSESASEWALRSYFGRINYDFQGKYLLEANVRRDGSSRFGENNRWGTFPSFSGGWIISNEGFFKSVKTINLLKVRASWGQLGNQYASGTDYPYAAQVSLNTNYVFNNVLAPGAAQTSFYNPNIKWETTTATNIGVEVSVLNRLTFEGDYFVKRSTDILFRLPVPATAGGLDNPVVNSAEVKNHGWELSTKYKQSVGKTTFQVGLNLTHVKSEVISLDPTATGAADQIIYGNFILKRGSPINSLYGLKAVGIFQTPEEIARAPVQFGNYAPGDIRFQDINNDGVVNDQDRTIIGKEDPTWYYGISTNFTYEGFDLSALVQGVSDFQSYGNLEFYNPFSNNAGLAAQWVNRWTPQNPTNNWPRLFLSDGPNVERTNSFWVQDRSFLRLKNIQLGYNLPGSISRRIGFEKFRLYVNVQNLFTITKFQGFDPERLPGFAGGGSSYPVLKILTAGLNITLK